jgi:hypothetical protein
MKQNMIISIVIVVAVCLVVVFFAVGYSRMLQPAGKPVPPTPEVTSVVVLPTEVPGTPAPTPTPETDYIGYIQRGTLKVELAKVAIQNGRSQMDPVLGVQGMYPDVVTTLYSAQKNFTTAKNLFVDAQSDYTNALKTAPRSQQVPLETLASTLNANARNSDLYIKSSQLGLANDWWNANNVYNQANLLYQANLQSTNELLRSMNLIT